MENISLTTEFVLFQLGRRPDGLIASVSSVKLSEAIISRDNTYLEHLDTLETQLHT